MSLESRSPTLPVPAAGARRRRTTIPLVLGSMPFIGAAIFTASVVGTRGIDVGTDTRTYAEFFLSYGTAFQRDNVEPGFLYLTRAMRGAGCDVTGYQTGLYLVLLVGVAVTARVAQQALAPRARYTSYVTAAFAGLLISPVFVSASVNVIRQGLASLFVIASFLSFRARRWRSFALFIVVASAFHYSSLLYAACAPLLLLKRRSLSIVAVAAFCAYTLGGTMRAAQVLMPEVYARVLEYGALADYRGGIRVDFAAFSFLLCAILILLSSLLKHEARRLFREALTVYVVLNVPFFVLGWGSFSDRYLLAPWLYASLLLGAVVSANRSRWIRDPRVARVAVILASGVFYWQVGRLAG